MCIETEMYINAYNQKSWEVVKTVFQNFEENSENGVESPEYDDEKKTIALNGAPIDINGVIEIAKQVHLAMKDAAKQAHDMDIKRFEVDISGNISDFDDGEKQEFNLEISLENATISDTGKYLYLSSDSYDDFCMDVEDFCPEIRELLSEDEFWEDTPYSVTRNFVYRDETPELAEEVSIYEYDSQAASSVCEDDFDDEDSDEDEDDEEGF